MEFTNAAAFLKYYSKIKKRTKRLFPCIPPDKIEWTYQEGKFTIGDLIRHIANSERYIYTETIQQKPSLYDGCGENYASGYENVIEFYNKQYTDSVEIISSLAPEDFYKKCKTPAGIEITIWKWLRLMVEHEIHHRGQLYVYLGLLGVEVPPIYGLTSEEVIVCSAEMQSNSI